MQSNSVSFPAISQLRKSRNNRSEHRRLSDLWQTVSFGFFSCLQAGIVDCDTQCSFSEWISEAAPAIEVVRMANADEVLEELPSLAHEADFVICDGPGSQTETSRALLMWADLAIIPCKARLVAVPSIR